MIELDASSPWTREQIEAAALEAVRPGIVLTPASAQPLRGPSDEVLEAWAMERGG